MKSCYFFALVLLLSSGCNQKDSSPAASPSPKSLFEARQGFKTVLLRNDHEIGAPPTPPATIFTLVKYPSPAGKLSAYVSPAPVDGKKHPAIIWLVGGFGNGIDENDWQKGPAENDQSASVFREAGLLMMYPSLRGGNDNPGCKEGFYGEVEDVMAAADFLSRLDYIDADRIYLGGHSTGGTLALLVAESTNRFRAVFAFGPVSDVKGYGAAYLPFELNVRELELRAPINWLGAIKTPTYVFEGALPHGNISSLRAMAKANQNAQVQFHPVGAVDHFSIIQPVSRLIAAKILADDAPQANIHFTDQELSSSLAR